MNPDSKIKMTLRWEKFDGALSRGLHELLGDKDLVDVTLASQGEYIKAHKNVLSVCSPYFKVLFKENPCKHPIVILQEAKLSHVKSLLQFMYCGETTVPQHELSAFLRTAETLKVRGLSDSDAPDDMNEVQTRLESHEEVPSSPKRKRICDPVESTELPLEWNLAGSSSSNHIAAEFVQLQQIKHENDVTVEGLPLEWGIATPAGEIQYVSEPTQHPMAGSSNINTTQQVCFAVTTPQPTAVNVSTDSNSAEMLSRILVMPQSEQREESINQLVLHLRASAGGTIQHRDSLPCKTVNDIIQLDQTLANDREYLARLSASLGLLGGKNPYQAVRRTFSEVIGHEVAEQYRWSGSQSGKRSITTLPNVLKLITNASMLNPASRSMTITEVEGILKVWLRSSGDREGGRNRRRRKEVDSNVSHHQQQQQQQPSDGNSYPRTFVTYRRTSNTSPRAPIQTAPAEASATQENAC